MLDDILFQVTTISNLTIRTTKAYWQKIIHFKHPNMLGREEDVKLTLQQPDEIRQSKQNKKVFLYYRKQGDNHICVIIWVMNSHGFVITTYVTDKIKEGISVWKK